MSKETGCLTVGGTLWGFSTNEKLEVSPQSLMVVDGVRDRPPNDDLFFTSFVYVEKMIFRQVSSNFSINIHL